MTAPAAPTTPFTITTTGLLWTGDGELLRI
jgi:hypothetical protein